VKACLRIAENKQAMTVMLEAKKIADCVASTALYLASGNIQFLSNYKVVDENITSNVSTKCIQLMSQVIDINNVKEKILEHKLFPVNWFENSSDRI